MLNIHTMGGHEMMKSTVDAIVRSTLRKNTVRPRILGVTLLTSIDKDTLSNDLGIQHSLRIQVKHLAKLAYNAGIDGVVASPQETEMIRTHFGKGFLIVTPGIRPLWYGPDDQKRTLTPKQAIRKGADYIVIGRAVMSQSDPVKALKRIHNEIETA
jgi:orotidine-5'-phosphate decarboxylase